MNERDKETIKLASTILGNVAAIAFGVALFEKNDMALGCAILAGIMAFLTIRRI